MTTLRPGGSEVTPEVPQDDNQETDERKIEDQEIQEETIQVDQATFKSKELVEQKEDFELAEKIEHGFVEVVEATEVDIEGEDEIDERDSSHHGKPTKMPAVTKGGGGVVVVDVCKTPASEVPVPIPYSEPADLTDEGGEKDSKPVQGDRTKPVVESNEESNGGEDSGDNEGYDEEANALNRELQQYLKKNKEMQERTHRNML